MRNYDYSRPGWYAVTIVTQSRRKLFGRVAGGRMKLTAAGEMVARAWAELPLHYSGVRIDEFIVMPDHMHGIVVIEAPAEANAAAPPARGTAAAPSLAQAVRTLPDVVHRFKSFTTAEYWRGVRQSGWPPIRGPLWQRSYWDDIVRTDDSLDRIRRYIRMNPVR